MNNDRRETEIDELALRKWFGRCDDVRIEPLGGAEDGRHDRAVLLIYCMGLIHDSDFRSLLLPRFIQAEANGFTELPPFIERVGKPEERRLAEMVFSGYVLCYYSARRELYAWQAADLPARIPEESNTEASIRGPKDGFVEDIVVNAALIRKRMRSNTLLYEQFMIGERSRTRTGLLYIEGIAREDIVRTARERLRGINIDSLLSGSQLEELLSDNPNALFPLLDYSGRPDYVVDSLLRGRLAILVDGSPNALIAPTNFALLLKSAEDAHSPFIFVALERLLRLAAFLVSVLLIGLWVALVNFHQTQLPFSTLSTVVLSRHGIPFTVPMEAFLIVALFEILREAGARLPKAVGQTLAVVGGLIIGDAAIRAGLSSPALIVVAAVTTISTFVLINQSLSGNVALLRLFVLICSSLLGIYGFLFATLLILLHMANLRSFGVPYLAPLSPLTPREFLPALLRLPWRKIKPVPDLLKQTGDRGRGGDLP